jgi:hypothetical protein
MLFCYFYCLLSSTILSTFSAKWKNHLYLDFIVMKNFQKFLFCLFVLGVFVYSPFKFIRIFLIPKKMLKFKNSFKTTISLFYCMLGTFLSNYVFIDLFLLSLPVVGCTNGYSSLDNLSGR